MDELPRAFAQMLFEIFPEWRRFAREETYADTSGCGLVVEVPSLPAADVKNGLIIQVDDEVTVGFDYYHSHFDPEGFYAVLSADATDTADDEGLSGVLAALKFIEDIVSERVVIVSYMVNDEWRGSTAMPAQLTPARPEYVGGRSYNRVRVRSWGGAHNADVKV